MQTKLDQTDTIANNSDHSRARQRPLPRLEWMEIPELSGNELCRMLQAAGFTMKSFSRFLQRSPNYVAWCLRHRARVPASVSEALYLFLGHDMYLTVFERITGRTPEIRHEP